MTTATVTADAGKLVRPALKMGALIGVLGVVYGDIGTSPLYALQSVLALFPNAHASNGEILGCLSLIFWSLWFLIVTVKYVLLVMRADNRGEGGILALMALAQRTRGECARGAQNHSAHRHWRRLPAIRRWCDHAGGFGAFGH